MSEISFTIPGHPEPAGSKQSFVPLDKRLVSQRWPRGEPYPNGRGGAVVTTVDANPDAGKWKMYVQAIARRHYHGPPATTAVSVVFRFYLPRPNAHFGSGRNAQRIRPSAPLFPAGKPDVLKLARAIEDALTGVVWKDDSQIVTELIEKCYGDPPRVEITVREAAAQPGLFEKV